MRLDRGALIAAAQSACGRGVRFELLNSYPVVQSPGTGDRGAQNEAPLLGVWRLGCVGLGNWVRLAI